MARRNVNTYKMRQFQEMLERNRSIGRATSVVGGPEFFNWDQSLWQGFSQGYTSASNAESERNLLGATPWDGIDLAALDVEEVKEKLAEIRKQWDEQKKQEDEQLEKRRLEAIEQGKRDAEIELKRQEEKDKRKEEIMNHVEHALIGLGALAFIFILLMILLLV